MNNNQSIAGIISTDRYGWDGCVVSNSRRGFTLIELLAVSVLIGLFAGMSIMRYAKMGTKTTLTNQTRQIYLAVKYARIAAVEKQKPFVLRLDETGRQIVVGPLEQEQTAPTDGQELLPSMATTASQASLTQQAIEPEPLVVKNAYVRPVLLNDKLILEQFLVEGQSTSVSQCVFYPDGTAQACVIQLGDGLRHASVFVTQTGRASMKIEAAQQIQTGRVDLDVIE